MQAITNAVSGRVTKIQIPNGETAKAIEIVKAPATGHLTVDPDRGALTYVSSDPAFAGSVDVAWTVVRQDGSVERVEHRLELSPSPQQAGWNTGADHYMLKTDDAGEVVVETGDNHRKVYVSGSDAALSKADIEAIEGVTIKNLGAWLRDHPQYGASEGMALDMAAGQALWSTLTGRNAEPSSHWLLLERGYAYNPGRLVERGSQGEDELHPLHVTAWGEGARPVINEFFHVFQEASRNVVISDLEMKAGAQFLSGSNIIMEDVRLDGKGLVVQNVDSITLRQMEILDAIRDAPRHGGDWETMNDRIQGLYVEKTDGLLLEQSFIDHTGWKEGYDAGGDGSKGQMPTMFSQNVYLQFDTTDVTFRDTISMRAASFGAQMRGGALAEDNLFIDNNAQWSTLGGLDSKLEPGVRTGNFSLSNGNVATSGAHKLGLQIGALTMGADDAGKMSAMVANIIAHLANPEDREEYLRKVVEHAALNGNGSRFFDDTVVHNWESSKHPHRIDQARNTEGRDAGLMNDTTIQNYAAELLGRQTATIADLADYWRELTASGQEIDIEHALAYFRRGFGVETVEKAGATRATFVPSELADGVRWDNRLNWDSGEIAGTVADTDVDLNGSLVQFGGTYRIDELEIGAGGRLMSTHGYLHARQLVGEGQIEVFRAGQIWIAGNDGNGAVKIGVSGGRFANDGVMAGAIDMSATAGQAILATGGGAMSVEAGRIAVAGGAKVGFDGPGGLAGLRLDAASSLHLSAANGALGTIREFRSGAFETSEVTSLVDVAGAGVTIDVSGLSGTGKHVLIQADVLRSTPSAITLIGLGARDAIVRTDLAADTFTLELVTGTGRTTFKTFGQGRIEAAAEARLWAELDAMFNTDVDTDVAVSPTPKPDTDAGKTGDFKPSAGLDKPVADKEEPVETDIDPVGETGIDTSPRPTPDPVPNVIGGNEGEGEERLTGTSLDDVLRGSAKSDELVGFAGNDRLIGRAGDDHLAGGLGDDRLTGNLGDDTLRGHGGDDFLGGGLGDDRLFGGAGNDVLRGSRGADHLVGGSGADLLSGNAGADRLMGGSGDDRLVGGIGDDVLRGGAGNDRLHGGPGHDRLFADRGSDALLGGAGNDLLVGGLGATRMIGGAGADRFIFDFHGREKAMGFIDVRDFDASEGDILAFRGVPDDGEIRLVEMSQETRFYFETEDSSTFVARIRGEVIDDLSRVHEDSFVFM